MACDRDKPGFIHGLSNIDPSLAQTIQHLSDHPEERQKLIRRTENYLISRKERERQKQQKMLESGETFVSSSSRFRQNRKIAASWTPQYTKELTKAFVCPLPTFLLLFLGTRNSFRIPCRNISLRTLSSFLNSERLCNHPLLFFLWKKNSLPLSGIDPC